MTARFKGIKGYIGDIIKKTKAIAAASLPVGSVFLFGSFARGGQTPLSDLDIAFLPRKKVSPAKAEKLDSSLYLKLAKSLGTDDVTLINLRGAPLVLAYNILQGKLLFCRDRRSLAEYKEYVLNIYPEIDRLRKVVAANYLRKMAKK
jgi:predicted nucleotidyltransferase